MKLNVPSASEACLHLRKAAPPLPAVPNPVFVIPLLFFLLWPPLVHPQIMQRWALPFLNFILVESYRICSALASCFQGYVFEMRPCRCMQPRLSLILLCCIPLSGSQSIYSTVAGHLSCLQSFFFLLWKCCFEHSYIREVKPRRFPKSFSHLHSHQQFPRIHIIIESW